MNFGNSTIMEFMGAQMRYQSQRQVVIAKNISNIDTPGYKAQEVKRVDFEDLVNRQVTRLEMKATAAEHQASSKPFDGPYRIQKDRKTYETSPEENSVTLEEQMARLSQNTTEHQLTTNLMKKYNGMYRTAGSGTQ